MVCTDTYVEKANKGIGGVGYEKMIITSDLLINDEYLREEAWDEYESLGQENLPILGLAKNIKPIRKEDIRSINWTHTELEECSIVEIDLINSIEKHTYPPCDSGVMCNNPLQNPTVLPDLDLHLHCANGNHIGINYETGEYEIDIEDALD